jgi:hypothetical protein
MKKRFLQGGDGEVKRLTHSQTQTDRQSDKGP